MLMVRSFPDLHPEASIPLFHHLKGKIINSVNGQWAKQNQYCYFMGNLSTYKVYANS